MCCTTMWYFECNTLITLMQLLLLQFKYMFLIIKSMKPAQLLWQSAYAGSCRDLQSVERAE